MKIDFIDQMVADGRIRKEAAAGIYRDAEIFVKEAGVPDAITQRANQVAPYVAGLLGMGAMYAHDKIQSHKEKKQMLKMLDKVVSKYTDDKDQAKAKARFDEIAKISPTAARSEPLMFKMVDSRLNEGISSEDAQRLALLEMAASKGSRPFGIPKMGSVPTISEHAAGSIYADVYIMAKVASLRSKFTEGAKKVLGPNFIPLLAVMSLTPALVGIGGGVAKMVSDAKTKKELEGKLEESFQKAIEMSDPEKEPLRQEPEKARQAFQALTHFAPHVATQPDAARSFMTKIISYDQGITTGDARDLSEIEKNLASVAQGGSFVQGFSATGKAIGLGPLTQKAVSEAAEPSVSDMKMRMSAELAGQRAGQMAFGF